MAPPDIFSALRDLRIPRHVYIIGCGPLGKPYHDAIPDDAYTMACNSLIASARPWKLYMVGDQQAIEQPWYSIDPQPETLTVVHRSLAPSHPRPDYTGLFGTLHTRGQLPIRGVFYIGGTVAGCMSELAYWGGCDHVTFCGVDMMGGEHWDGEPAPWASNCRIWPQTARLQDMIDALAPHMRFDTLSDSALKLNGGVVTIGEVS